MWLLAPPNSKKVKKMLEQNYFGQKNLIGQPVQVITTTVNNKETVRQARRMKMRVLIIHHMVRIQQKGFIRPEVKGDRCTLKDCNCGNKKFAIELKNWGMEQQRLVSGAHECWSDSGVEAAHCYANCRWEWYTQCRRFNSICRLGHL